MHSQNNIHLEKLLTGYDSYFDIQRFSEENLWQATAHFHSYSTKYALAKSAKLWSIEMHEYTYFALCSDLNLDKFILYKEQAIADGLALIKPHKEHMYSYITLILLCENISLEAKKNIQTCKFHKNFLFSLHGWADLRVAVVDIPAKEVINNKLGKDVKKNIMRTFYSEE